MQEAGASLFTIAKDVKLQVEFNPATVAEYRLVGYETRALKREDFNNDAVDAGDVGSGHTVTAIYEITPVGSGARMVDESRYADRTPQPPNRRGSRNEYGFLKIRYKLPGERSRGCIEQPIPHRPRELRRRRCCATCSSRPRWRDSRSCCAAARYTGALSYDDVIARRRPRMATTLRLPRRVRAAGAQGEGRARDEVRYFCVFTL